MALVVFGWKGKAAKRNGDLAVLRRLKHFAGYGCLVVWVVNTVFWCLPSRFAWSSSLPLQFCNLANLIGAAAVLGGGRFWKTILYFWMPVLCIWAFLTPVLHGGYATFEFWIFWIYHLFIPLALTEVLVVQDYRPTFADLKKAWMFTVGYMALLAVPDYLFEWNYGFVGPSKPDSPTLIDVLGPYPWRLFWMIAIGTVLYLLVWLPGRRWSIEPC
ncbi:MAG: TIGR02206 family membrane protein [Verrucomicrobiae bacterium]|nr:TIGR02206 family membrane protein [Verrucomicrobiae bacterium]